MSHPVTTLRLHEPVGRLVDVLQENYYSGYPVVQDYDPEQVRTPPTVTDVVYIDALALWVIYICTGLCGA